MQALKNALLCMQLRTKKLAKHAIKNLKIIALMCTN